MHHKKCRVQASHRSYKVFCTIVGSWDAADACRCHHTAVSGFLHCSESHSRETIRQWLSQGNRLTNLFSLSHEAIVCSTSTAFGYF